MTQQPAAPSLAGSPLPRITIVTPATSGDEHLEATLRSTIFQDYPNLEFIVIEDGTSSERRRILKKYEAHLSWQLCPPATELCAALNMAFAKSSGEILSWREFPELTPRNCFADLPGLSRMFRRCAGYGTNMRFKPYTALRAGIGRRKSSPSVTSGFLIRNAISMNRPRIDGRGALSSPVRVTR